MYRNAKPYIMDDHLRNLFQIEQQALKRQDDIWEGLRTLISKIELLEKERTDFYEIKEDCYRRASDAYYSKSGSAKSYSDQGEDCSCSLYLSKRRLGRLKSKLITVKGRYNKAVDDFNKAKAEFDKANLRSRNIFKIKIKSRNAFLISSGILSV